MGINNIVSEIKESRDYTVDQIKSISGMTRLIEPQILRDFPKFNKNELYSKCEKDLRIIFNDLENKTTSDLDYLFLIKETINQIIKDMNNSNLEISYNNIKFHQFAIKNYTNELGAATISVVTSLEYDYSERENNRLIKDLRIQTRYTCDYIYIYDELLFDKNTKSFTLHCPNCGANVTTIGNKKCSYCGSIIYDLNLSSWQLSSYKEY